MLIAHRSQVSWLFTIRTCILFFILVWGGHIAPSFAQVNTQIDRLGANLSGGSLERRLALKFKAANFEIIRYKDWRESLLYTTRKPRFVILDAPYQSVFGHRAKIEFLVIINNRQILVEAKRQMVAGSVDEKLAYVYLNAVHNIPNRDYVLVMEGHGFKPEAQDWIRRMARSTDGFTVLTFSDFDDWLRTL